MGWWWRSCAVEEVPIGLADAIAELRKELSQALAAGEGEEVRFKLGEVELEFNLEVKREGGAGGGVRFWVVSLEAKGGLARATQHRIKLKLQPEGAGGEELRVRDQPPREPR